MSSSSSSLRSSSFNQSKQKKKPQFRNAKQSRIEKQKQSEQKQNEITELKRRWKNEAPPRGINPLIYDFQRKTNQVESDQSSTSSSSSSTSTSTSYSAIRRFSELPLSRLTLSALTAASFLHLTDIQRASLPHSLAGRSILGAARTGSGKTLCFLIPILERLYSLNWNSQMGIGAIVISPTRELAIQIFDVLRQIGKNHVDLSAGLVIGGKDVAEEQKYIDKMNILISTPGRLLHHMDQTYGFDCSGVSMLVIDEADRILDLGFAATMNSILQNLPSAPQRQTLLFSATQTKSISDLSRLSFSSSDPPEYISVHEAENQTTPNKLEQYYYLVENEDKWNLLFNFMKTHLKEKTIVFLSSSKQVRFAYEMYRRLRPGIPLLSLYGKMKQEKRMSIYQDFMSKENILLFSTDIAARGLDWKTIDWVIQFDAPESVQTYIHRVGRTARYRQHGKSLLFLTQSESFFIELLKTAKITNIKKVKVHSSNLKSVTLSFANTCASDPEMKYLSQKAFISYVKSIYLQKNKTIFNIKGLNLEKMAEAMGLNSIPKMKILHQQQNKKQVKEGEEAGEGEGRGQDEEKRKKEESEKAAKVNEEASQKVKNMPYALRELLSKDGKTKKKSKDDRGMSSIDKLLLRQNHTIYDPSRMALRNSDDEDEEDENDESEDEDDKEVEKKVKTGKGRTKRDEGESEDEVLTVKRRDHALESESDTSSDSDSASSAFGSDSNDSSHAQASSASIKTSSKRSSSRSPSLLSTPAASDLVLSPSDSASISSQIATRALALHNKRNIRRQRAGLSPLSLPTEPSVDYNVKERALESLRSGFVGGLKTNLGMEDNVDKRRDHERVHAKHVEKRIKLKEYERRKHARAADDEDGDEEDEDGGVRLTGASDDEDEEEEEEDQDEDDEEGQEENDAEEKRGSRKRNRKDDNENSKEEQSNSSASFSSKRARSSKPTLAEQEKLALSLLNA